MTAPDGRHDVTPHRPFSRRPELYRLARPSHLRLRAADLTCPTCPIEGAPMSPLEQVATGQRERGTSPAIDTSRQICREVIPVRMTSPGRRGNVCGTTDAQRRSSGLTFRGTHRPHL